MPQDPWCDPDHPILLKFEDISAAAYRIKDGIINTPCDRSHMNSDLGLEMYFKKDYMQVVMARDTKGVWCSVVPKVSLVKLSSPMTSTPTLYFVQFTGSFKERGARYTLKKLSAEQRAIGVIAASAGK